MISLWSTRHPFVFTVLFCILLILLSGFLPSASASNMVCNDPGVLGPSGGSPYANLTSYEGVGYRPYGTVINCTYTNTGSNFGSRVGGTNVGFPSGGSFNTNYGPTGGSGPIYFQLLTVGNGTGYSLWGAMTSSNNMRYPDNWVFVADFLNGSATLTGQGHYYYMSNTIPIGGLIASFLVTPGLTGYTPFSVMVTDTSQGNPAPNMWSWYFGGVEHGSYTLSTANHTYVNGSANLSGGVYIINETVSNGCVTAYAQQAVTVYPSALPVMGLSSNLTSGNAPLVVAFNDTSGSGITQRSWNFNADNIPQTTITCLDTGGSTSYVLSPVCTFSSSGAFSILQSDTNSAGTNTLYSYRFITVNGSPPAPTPTPTSPNPNQGTVCYQGSISLGSGTYPNETLWTISSPEGNTFYGYVSPGGSYPIVAPAGATLAYGGYLFHIVDPSPGGSVLYSSSYTVIDCSQKVNGTNQTTTVNPTIPPVSPPGYSGTPSIPIFPTVTGTISENGSAFTPPVNFNNTLVQPIQIPGSLPSLTGYLNSTTYLNDVCGSALGVVFCPVLTLITNMFNFFNGFVNLILSLILSPFILWNTIFTYTVSLQGSLLAGFAPIIGVYLAVMFQTIAAFPNKVINTMIIIMTFNCLESLIDYIRGSGGLRK